MLPYVKVWGLDNASPVIPGVEAFQRVGTKWMIDATKPAVTHPEGTRALRQGDATQFAAIDLRIFCPDGTTTIVIARKYPMERAFIVRSGAAELASCYRLRSCWQRARRLPPGLSDAAGPLVVGFTAGGPTDRPARFIADKLSDMLGQAGRR